MESSVDDRLVGLWSADARYGPGAQSDEVLWFRPDGTGRRDFYNFALCTVEYFEWTISATDRISVTWDRVVSWSNEGVTEEHSHGVQQLSFTIAQEPTPAGKTAEVLRIELGWQEGAFARITEFDPGSFESPSLGL